jgi:DNA excision repair protein ERCC-2
MCPKSEVDCRAERCEFAQGYYDRLKSSRALEILRETGCATSDLIHKLGIDLTLCPFELSLDATHRADVIICDYNYVLAPRATMVRHFGTPEKAAEALVVVDEAHNLQSRACGWFSPTISHQQLSELNPRESALEEKKLRARLARLHKELRRMLEALEGEERLLESNTADLLSLERRLGQLLVDAQSQGERLPPGDTAVRLFRLVFDFAEAFRNWGPQFFSTWKPNFGGGQWEIVCADASTHLRERLAPLPAFVAFSATLKPFEFHATLLGLDTAKLQTAEFLSPFPRDHRKLLVVPQISTAWRDRERSIPQIAETISRLLPLRLGNYIVFFPSFDFMSRVLDNVVLPSFEILTQPRGASTADIDALLGALNERRNIALFAVQGGSLAEGIDCPGDSLIGTVVVGPPLPTYDVGREAMRDYYQKTYGRGQEYAYIYPAMARAVQAAGRVIRGPDDRGLILLLDKRFLRGEFARCMPVDWYYDSPKELVSQGLLHDISNFWDGTHVP